MKAPAWKGDHPITAGWEYSSGTGHYSWDVAMNSGNPIYAPVDGEVLDYVTGVPNVPGGSGSPSNWILLGFKLNGNKVCYYFQHLKSANVKKGQTVKEGTQIGQSGNSGNSSGPHLHLTLQQGWKNSATRYDYMDNNGKTAIYEPDKGWEDMALSDSDIKKIADKVWSYQIEVRDSGKPPKTYKALWFLQNIWDKVK
jgi:murein DD-endopeptidase MepM/ murein hydrolase activator NlpD